MSSLSDTDRNIQAVNAELTKGGIQGSIQLANIDLVTCDALIAALETLKKMNGRSNDIMAAVYSGDAAVLLRKILIATPVNWSQVKAHADKILLPVNVKKLVPDLIPEFELARDVANDHIMIATCTQALNSVGPLGSPENLDTSKMTTEELAAVCNTAILESTAVRSDKATQMISACKLIKGIRENLIKAGQNKPKGENATQSMAAVAKTVEAYRNVKSLVATAYKVHKSNVSDAAWDLIKAEITLAIKAAHIWEARNRIEEAVMSSTKVYAMRAAQAPVFNDTPKVEAAVKTPVRRGSVLTQVGADVLSTFDLDRLIDDAYKMDMISNALGGYIECAQSIRRVRNCVIDQDWDQLRKLKHDQVVQNELNTVPAAGNKELDNAFQEYQNKDAQESLEKILNTAFDSERPELSITELEKCIRSIENVKITSAVSNQYLECARQVLQLRKGMQHNVVGLINDSLKWFAANPNKYPVIVQHEVVAATMLHENNQLMEGLLRALSMGAASGSLDNRDFSTVVTRDLENTLELAKNTPELSPEVTEFVHIAEGVLTLRRAQQLMDFDALREAMAPLVNLKSIHPLVIDEVAAARADVENDNIVQILTNAVLSFEEDAPVPSPSLVSRQNLFSDRSSPQTTAPGTTGTGAGGGTGKSRRYSYVNMNCQDIDRDTIDVDTLKTAISTAEAFGVHTFSQEAKRLLRTVKLLLRIREAMKVDDWVRIRQIIDEQEIQGAIASTSNKSSSNAFGSSTNNNPTSPGSAGGVAGFVDFTFASTEDHSIDVLADKEIQVIHAQLEMRNSLAAVMKYIGPEHGAKCCYGLVDVKQLLAVELYNATEKAAKSVAQEQQLTAQKAKMIDDEDGDGARSSYTPFGGNGSSIASSQARTRASRSNSMAGKNEETKLLLSSAKHLASVRMLLYKGQYEAAGMLAERIIFNVNNNGISSGGAKDGDGEALPTKLHPLVMDELYLYATEVGEALVSSRICKMLFEAKRTSDLADLMDVVEYAVMERNGELWDQDLGLVRLIDLSLKRMGMLSSQFTSVVNAMGGSDTRLLKRVSRIARANNVSSHLLELADAHVAKLREYEEFVQSKCVLCGGGIVTGIKNHQDIVAKAAQFGLESHILARRSAAILGLHPASKRIANIVRAVSVRNLGVIVRETMGMKRAFLETPSSLESFALKKYPLLRDLDDFGMRMTLESGELKETMLLSTDKNIPTSLTRLSPPLAVYGVYVFIHCIRPLQEHVYTMPQVILRNLVFLGRYCPPMRDEIYLQIAKQLRNNPKEPECNRLWRVLGVCLKYFPPSIELENYLELFLIECYNRNGSIVDAEALAISIAANSYRPNLFLPSSIPSKLSSGSASAAATAAAASNKQAAPEVRIETHEYMTKSAAYHCIEAMHIAIVRFGYGSRISEPCDLTLDMCRRWLSHTESDIDLTPARIVRPPVETAAVGAGSTSTVATDSPITSSASTADSTSASSMSDRYSSGSGSGSGSSGAGAAGGGGAGRRGSNLGEEAAAAAAATAISTCPFEHLFASYDAVSAKAAARLAAVPNRGSKDNWKRRFYQFSQDKETMDCDAFVASLTNSSPAPIVPVLTKPSPLSPSSSSSSSSLSSPRGKATATMTATVAGAGMSGEETGVGGGAGAMRIDIDRKDYQVLMLIVTGQYPTHKSALIREYLHENNNFVDAPATAAAATATVTTTAGKKSSANSLHVSAVDAQANVHQATVNSHKRRTILKKVIYPPKIKPEDRCEAAAQFWKRVVLPVLAIGAAPPMSATTTASGGASTGTSAGTGADAGANTVTRRNSKEELLSTPPSKVASSSWSSKFGKGAAAAAATDDAAKGMSANTGLKKIDSTGGGGGSGSYSSSNNSSSREELARRRDSSSSSSNSSNSSNGKTDTESSSAAAAAAAALALSTSLMTWDVYRDVILAGIEWLIDHEEGDN